MPGINGRSGVVVGVHIVRVQIQKGTAESFVPQDVVVETFATALILGQLAQVPVSAPEHDHVQVDEVAGQSGWYCNKRKTWGQLVGKVILLLLLLLL